MASATVSVVVVVVVGCIFLRVRGGAHNCYTMSTTGQPLFVYLQGGLGNQLFIVAAAYRHVERLAELGVTPTPHLVFSTQTNEGMQGRVTSRNSYTSSLLSWLPRSAPMRCTHVYREPPFGWIEDTASMSPITSGLLVGYFQHRDLVTPLPKLVEQHLVSSYLTAAVVVDRPQGRRRLGVHVRRTDYTTLQNVFVQLDVETYYRDALARALAADDAPPPFDEIVLVSDEPVAALKELQPLLSEKLSGVPVTVMHHPVATSSEQDDLDDFFALASCHTVIMANSTFSWWAALLSHVVPREDAATPIVTIGPARWFVDRKTPRLDVEVGAFPGEHHWIMI